MERREDALREALLKNSEETDRWESYKKENEVAIQNLQEFSKHLSVDVMVPVGKKALMPGQLIHTNEVLVGHYQGYFSKCSAHKATEICELRLKQAKEQLINLEAEAELWQNKLEKPYLEGVLPNAGEREIIEDYDEELEKRWREEHKIMVKRAKLKEKQEREEEPNLPTKASKAEEEKRDEDIFKMLEEAELMEELEKELDNLDIDEVNDETIRQLMAGEVELSKQKPRTAHDLKSYNKTRDSSNLNGVVKKTIAKSSTEMSPPTNNNTRVNPEINITHNESADDVDDDELPEEVKLIRDQAKFLPASDQIGFYEYQVEIIRQKVAKIRMTKESDIDEKLHLLSIQAELEDLLALAEDEIENIVSESEDNIDSNEKTVVTEMEKADPISTQKRRISFALENETLIFRDSEAVSQMLPRSASGEDEDFKRDVITLNNKLLKNSADNIEIQSPRDKKQSILEKVEKNRQHITNLQSQVDSDLVTKIIDDATSTTETIFITFKHSDQQSVSSTQIATSKEAEDSEESFIPGKPSDFYDLYLKQQQNVSPKPTNIYVNSYNGEENVKTPILKESNRKKAYEDPRTKFSNPNNMTENGENSIPTKSILRNKLAVESETHLKNTAPSKKQKKKQPAFNDDEYMSAYYKVMNDVVEKPLTEPDPLPQEKFIDAHTPKKRVSRFKQMRSETEKS